MHTLFVIPSLLQSRYSSEGLFHGCLSGRLCCLFYFLSCAFTSPVLRSFCCHNYASKIQKIWVLFTRTAHSSQGAAIIEELFCHCMLKQLNPIQGECCQHCSLHVSILHVSILYSHISKEVLCVKNGKKKTSQEKTSQKSFLKEE